MSEVFISYSHANREAARIIADMITAKGYDVWWDRDLIAGDDYAEIIEETIDTAKAVIVVWSEKSRKSHWVRDEAAVGRDRNRLLPVTIDGNPPPLGFRQIHTVDLHGWDGKSEDRLEDIFNGLKGLVRDTGALIEAEPEPVGTNPFGAVETSEPETVETKMVFAGVNAAPKNKPMAQIRKEEKRQRSFLQTFWITSLIISAVFSVALGLFANYTDSFSGEHWIVNVIVAFIFVGGGLILGRFLIAWGRRLSKRKSMMYFDNPTLWCMGVSVFCAVLLYFVSISETEDYAADTVSDSVFTVGLTVFIVVFPVAGLVSLFIGLAKGQSRTSY